MTPSQPPGRVMVVSGPGGVGKGTVVAALKDRNPDLALSVSATTRARRPAERDGVHYHFVDRDTFQDMVDDGEFVEWAWFNGEMYGTPWSSIAAAAESGSTIILEIDVQGALQIRYRERDVGDVTATLVFLAPPSWEVLEERLRRRGSENQQSIEDRLRIGQEEMRAAEWFDEVVVNDHLDAAVVALERILAGASSP